METAVQMLPTNKYPCSLCESSPSRPHLLYQTRGQLVSCESSRVESRRTEKRKTGPMTKAEHVHPIPSPHSQKPSTKFN